MLTDTLSSALQLKARLALLRIVNYRLIEIVIIFVVIHPSTITNKNDFLALGLHYTF